MSAKTTPLNDDDLNTVLAWAEEVMNAAKKENSPQVFQVWKQVSKLKGQITSERMGRVYEQKRNIAVRQLQNYAVLKEVEELLICIYGRSKIGLFYEKLRALMPKGLKVVRRRFAERPQDFAPLLGRKTFLGRISNVRADAYEAHAKILGSNGEYGTSLWDQAMAVWQEQLAANQNVGALAANDSYLKSVSEVKQTYLAMVDSYGSA